MTSEAGSLPGFPALSESIKARQRANILAAVRLIEAGKLVEFRRRPRLSPPLHIVGGGHSAEETIRGIEGHVCAVNGAHDWLIGRGVVPEYALFIDWTDYVATHITPHADVTYLVSSQCHPLIWKTLEGRKVRVFHTSTASGIVPAWTQVFGGGPNATQRVIPVLYEWGYREFHFHGVDGCFAAQRTHVYDWGRVGTSGEEPLTAKVMGREFRTRRDWLYQAQSFLAFLDIYDTWMKDGSLERIVTKVHGDGLIPHIARMRGCHVHSVNADGDG